MSISNIKITISILYTLFLMGCSLNTLKYENRLKEGQALLNPISETVYTEVSSSEVDLKILSINGQSTSLFSFSNTHIVKAGDVEFLVRCYYNNRKSFTKFKLNLKSKKVYTIRAIAHNKETTFNVLTDEKIIATKSVKTKLLHREGINF